MTLPTKQYGDTIGHPLYFDEFPVKHGAMIHFVNNSGQHIPATIDDFEIDARENPTGRISVKLRSPDRSEAGVLYDDSASKANRTWHFPWQEIGA